MFTERCSLYANAKDRQGIGTVEMREFLFTDRWKPQVSKLRELIADHGAAAAKAMPEYQALKRQLPGATLSGEFRVRRGDALVRHTGYIALDIDKGDNEGISNPDNIAMVLRFRPEVAMFMHSCSGTGLFALVRLAYPEKHKEQFQALYDEYKALGITLDKACSDITRIRFASYDDQPYINERCVAYRGLYVPKRAIRPMRYDLQPQERDQTAFIDKLVTRLERDHANIADDYDTWYKIGFCFASMGEGVGRGFFHRVSALSGNYNAAECDKKFDELLRSVSKSTIAGFIALVGNLYYSGTVSWDALHFPTDHDRKCFWHRVINGE